LVTFFAAEESDPGAGVGAPAMCGAVIRAHAWCIENIQMNNTPSLKPLSWGPSFLALFIVAGMLYLTHYFFVPYYTHVTHQPYLVGYLIGWVSTVAIISAASLIAYKIEGNNLNLQSFSSRYRLKKISVEDCLWAVAILVVAAGAYFGLAFTSEWLASFRLFAPHPAFPADMTPQGIANIKPGVLFGMSLKGQWWIVIVYLIGWVLNILGEEFWYRGWMLPRQEVAFGKFAWIINGACFTFQHWMQPWNFLAILPGALFMSFVIQLRKNTWIGILQHGVMNLGLFVHVLRGVIG
jgi:membrane protease YdiL (CAAX protease family)